MVPDDRAERGPAEIGSERINQNISTEDQGGSRECEGGPLERQGFRGCEEHAGGDQEEAEGEGEIEAGVETEVGEEEALAERVGGVDGHAGGAEEPGGASGSGKLRGMGADCQEMDAGRGEQGEREGREASSPVFSVGGGERIGEERQGDREPGEVTTAPDPGSEER
jgi:hypothetical protein